VENPTDLREDFLPQRRGRGGRKKKKEIRIFFTTEMGNHRGIL
jgi:hypothetical protein